jgi:hypothetical protein
LNEETDDEAITVYGRADYRDFERASGWFFGEAFVPEASDQRSSGQKQPLSKTMSV